MDIFSGVKGRTHLFAQHGTAFTDQVQQQGFGGILGIGRDLLCHAPIIVQRHVDWTSGRIFGRAPPRQAFGARTEFTVKIFFAVGG
jgi:hypothetical protein